MHGHYPVENGNSLSAHIMGSENLSDVLIGTDSLTSTLTLILKEYGSYSLAPHDSTPHHDAMSSPSMSLNDTVVAIVCTALSVSSHPPVKGMISKQAFIRLEN